VGAGQHLFHERLEQFGSGYLRPLFLRLFVSTTSAMFEVNKASTKFSALAGGLCCSLISKTQSLNVMSCYRLNLYLVD
jgi:hypothetical protein